MGQKGIMWYYGWATGLAAVSAVCLMVLGILCLRLRIFRRHGLFFKVILSVFVLAGLSMAAALWFLLPGLTARAEERPIEVEFWNGEGKMPGKGEAAEEDGFPETVFSREPVTARLIFKDKNFDKTSVMISVGDGRGKETVLEFGTEGWNGAQGLGTGVMEIGEWEEERDGSHVAELQFLQEGSYWIHKISCGDLAGNKTVLEKAGRVVLDGTAPKLAIELPEGDNPLHPGCYSSQVTVWFYLEERYFREGEAPEVSVRREEGTEKNGGEEYGPESAEHRAEEEPAKVLEGGAEEEAAESESPGSESLGELPDGWMAASERGLDWYKYPVVLREDGIYRLSMSYRDPAGNGFPENMRTEVALTVDATAPDQGTITALGKEWKSFWEKVSVSLYSSEYVPVCLAGADRTSPVEPLQYYCSEKELTREELDLIPGELWKTGNSLLLEENTRTIVYLKVTNYAGLWSYFSSGGIVVENKGPLVTLAVQGTPGEEAGFYLGDVTVQVGIEESRESGVVSGLSAGGYYLAGPDGELAESGNFPGISDGTSPGGSLEEWHTGLSFTAEKYDESRLKLTVWAEDRAGNRTEKTEEFTIDRTAPEIAVRFGGPEAVNGRYYNKGRNAQVTIREPDFSGQAVQLIITNTEGVSPRIGDWSHEGQVHRLQVFFEEDGEYSFSVKCRDRAGNEAESRRESFVIDCTPPEISVEFGEDGGGNGAETGVYPAARRAVLTVKERNFSGEGLAAEDCQVGSFVSRGDIHMASLFFEKDGDYNVCLDYTDLAGNSPAEEFRTSFTIDTVCPQITIDGIADNSANGGNLEAFISCQDKNLKKNSFAVSLLRLEAGQWKKAEAEPMLFDWEGAEKGSVYLSRAVFPKTEETDGYYLLLASGMDRAGNQSERKLRFSVNRFGSVYRAAGATAAWLYPADGSYPYLKEEQEVILLEYNVDEVADYRLAVSRDGNLRELLEGTDFERKEEILSGETPGKQYQYRIKKEIFSEEGNYELVLYSGDRAGNKMGNTAAKTEKRKAVFVFSVDKTGPTALLSGGESGTWYNGREKKLSLILWDSMGLAKVETVVDGEKTIYEGEALDEVLEKGKLELTLPAKDSWQTVKVQAWDRAGNPLEEILSAKGELVTEGEESWLEWKFLVTDNWWISLFRRPVYRYAGAMAAGLMIGAAIVIPQNRRRKRKGELNRKGKFPPSAPGGP